MLDAPQDMVGRPSCQGTLLAHIQLAVNHKPQIPLCGAALKRLVAQSVRIARVAPSQVQDPALLLNFMWLVIAQPSNLSRSLCKAFPPSSKFGVVSKFAQNTF